MADYGRTNVKHVLIDLDSWCLPEFWLHVFKQQIHIGDGKLIVIEEGGFARDGPNMKTMTAKEFKSEYGIEAPKLE